MSKSSNDNKSNLGTVYDDDPEDYNKETIISNVNFEKIILQVKEFVYDKQKLIITISAVIILILLIILMKGCSDGSEIETNNNSLSNLNNNNNNDDVTDENELDELVDDKDEFKNNDVDDVLDKIDDADSQNKLNIKSNNENQLQEDISEELETVVDNELIEKHKNITLLDEGTITELQLAEFKHRLTCNKGYNIMELYTEYNQLPSKITFEINSIDTCEFGLLKEITGSFENYNYLYFCDDCNLGDEFVLPKNHVYEMTIVVEIFGKTFRLDRMTFSTYPNSDVLDRQCSADNDGCSDTENVRNPNARGRLTVDGIDYVEFCANQTATEEYYCVDGEMKMDVVSCGVKCWLGRCID